MKDAIMWEMSAITRVVKNTSFKIQEKSSNEIQRNIPPASFETIVKPIIFELMLEERSQEAFHDDHVTKFVNL